MDIFQQKLKQEFEICKDHTSHIKDEVILLYYKDIDSFKKDRDLFFEAPIEKIEKFYSLEYPFKGYTVFDEEMFMSLVNNIPEFIVSLIKRGMPAIITLPNYQVFERNEPVVLSLNNMKESSQIIFQSWVLLIDIIRQKEGDINVKLKQLIKLLDLFQYDEPIYDILGLFQNIYSSIIILCISHGYEGFAHFKLIIHGDSIKRKTLYSLGGRELTPLQILDSMRLKDSIEDLPSTITNNLNDYGYASLDSSSQYFIEEQLIKPFIEIDNALDETSGYTEEITVSESTLGIKLENLKIPFITQSKILLNSLVRLQPFIDSKIKILIKGETGTGKDVLANAIHELSKRKGQFRAINCAGISSTLFESEIFGHEKGAFTGATEMKMGAFELANNGTLFLDEIGDLPLEQQAKFLRAIESNKFTRLGGKDEIALDVRVITATHIDIEHKISEKLFREDLYYRINGYEINLIPLNKRVEDIPFISLRLFNKHANLEKVALPKGMLSDTFLPLSEKTWSGNVRQLDNYIHRIVVLFKNSKHTLTDLNLLVNGKEIELAIERDQIFVSKKERQFFDAYIQTGYSINETWKKLRSSKDTASKIIYGIFVRLLVNTGDENSSVLYLVDHLILHNEQTQEFEIKIKTQLESLKLKILENNPVKRQLYPADELALRTFLNKT